MTMPKPTTKPIPTLNPEGQVLAAVQGTVGVLTLNRAAALNALSLDMVRDLSTVLRHWQADEAVHTVLLQGAGRPGKAPAFCAGGDIRMFHQAALAGDARLGDFFTEEYALNHLIHKLGKARIVLMDGVCMGGGMGLAQGCTVRVVTEHSKLAMPETLIGLFPDVGGGWFLSRCPGHVGEYLGLTGQVMGAADAMAFGLADVHLPAERLPGLLEALGDAASVTHAAQAVATVRAGATDPGLSPLAAERLAIDEHFAHDTVAEIVASLATDDSPFAQASLAALRLRSPLMLSVTLRQIRQARAMSLADDLRMERDLVQHCFERRSGLPSDTVEGVRALVIDKDHAPRWNPPTLDAVSADEIEQFFTSPWDAAAHPLRDL
jgi:enoyl-CoA hydratase/carnithine racemase